MKRKFLFSLLVAIVATALNVNAQVQTSASSILSKSQCPWDSVYTFEEDSVWNDKQVVMERDAVNNTELVYSYEWNESLSRWKPLHVHKYCYDAQGRLSLYLGCEPDDFEDYTFNDSTVYIYGNQERIEIKYFTDEINHIKYINDSTHYTLDAMGSVLEKVHYYYNKNRTIISVDKETYTYDPASHLMLTDSVFRYNGNEWVFKDASIYTVKDGKYVSSIDYNFNMKDTLFRYEYVYDADKIVEIDRYSKTSGIWTSYVEQKKVFTYNNSGDVLTMDVYDSEDGVTYTYSEGERYFRKAGYERIVVETDSTKSLNGVVYTVEPCDFHGGAVYVYDRGTFNATDVDFEGNEATLGAAIYNTGTTNLNGVTFTDNKAKMGGAIYNFDGTININGPITLVNDSDTWVNEGYKTGAEPQYAVTNWNLGKTPDDNEAILYGYEKFANYGHYAKQTITVAKNQTRGTYTIAIGDCSNVENKDKFYITGVEGQEDIAVFIGGATKNYDGQGYTLRVNGVRLYLEIGKALKTLDVAVSSMNKATIYSDKNLVVPAGVRVFGMRWDDSKNMLVCTNSRAYTDGDILPAEMGYVIEAPAATYSFLETEQDASVVSLSELSGVVVETPKDEVEGTVFTLANGYNGVGFYTFVGETLKANKAFYNSTNPNLKGYLGHEEATGIETSLTPTLSSREGVYNLQGQQVNNNYRGVVIKNGKKVIMK